jgi:putative oxidoreductase
MMSKLGIEPAQMWAWVLSITEFVGGICVFFGFLTRFWAAGLVIDMAVAIFKVNIPNGFFAGKNGFELPMAFGVMALVILLTGPGSLSVDRATGIEKGGAG